LRVGLASAVAGALAAAQTARLARNLSARVRALLGDSERSAADEWLGAAAGLLLAGSYAAAFQAVRPEVYALSTLLVVSALEALVAFDATGNRRSLYAAALYGGLALTNHHLLAIAALLPAAGLLLARRPRPHAGRAVLRVLVAGALGLALIAYLPLRAARHPLVDWGAPTTWAHVYWTVSARAFQKAVTTRGTPADLPQVAGALAVELRLLGALLAVGGAYLLARLARLRRVGLALLAAMLAVLATPALVGFDPANPDAYGYLEGAVAIGAVLASVVPAALFARLRARERSRRLAGAALVATTLLVALVGLPRASLASDFDASRVLGPWLDTMPPRALVVTSNFQTVFGLWYLRAVEGTRPDCALVHRHFLSYPGYRDDLVRAAPELAPWLGDHDLRSEASASDRPLVIEYDLDLPAGWVAGSTVIPFSLATDEPQARRFAAWQAYLAAHRACRLPGVPGVDERRRALARARAIIGPSPELDALAHGCGLGN
jgi:hypothetical protein